MKSGSVPLQPAFLRFGRRREVILKPHAKPQRKGAMFGHFRSDFASAASLRAMRNASPLRQNLQQGAGKLRRIGDDVVVGHGDERRGGISGLSLRHLGR